MSRRFLPPLVPDSEPWANTRVWARSLLLIVLVGAILRAAHLTFVRKSPFFSSLILDARAYDEWAQRIAGGALVGSEAFFVDPLYAYVLGALYRSVGHDLLIARALNAALGLATAVLIAATARRVWQSQLAGLIAAAAFALFMPMIHFEAQVEKTALTACLVALALWTFTLGSARAIAAAGAALGLCVLARGNALLLLPLGALALWQGWDREPSDPEVATPALRARRAGLWLACALPIIGLATLHNFLATSELIPTTTNFGINLYIGNHPDNPHGAYDSPSFLTPNTESERVDFRAEALRRTGEELDDKALSSYWAGQAWQVVWEQPGLALQRELHKLTLALHQEEVPDSESVELVSHWSPLLRSPVVWFGQLLVLAVLGAVIGWGNRGVRIVVIVALTYLSSLLPFFVLARLRVQLAVPLAVLAGGAVTWLVAMVRAQNSAALMRALPIAAAVALFAFYRPDWMQERKVASLAIGWHDLGVTLERLNREDEAIDAYEQAVATAEHAVPASLRALGRHYQARGDYERAERAMRKVIELRPQSPSAKAALRGLYELMLRDPRYADDPERIARRDALLGGAQTAASPSQPTRTRAQAAIANARKLASTGQIAQAIATLQAEVRQGPYDEDLHYVLGETMSKHATPDEMIAFFSNELARDQKPQTSHYYWAIALARKGDVDGAIAQLKQALAVDPAHEVSQQRWGLLLEQQGKLEEALEHLEESTRIHPELTGALRDAARVAEKLGKKDAAAAYLARAASADPQSPRRFLHWARYLRTHGRNEAALAEVARMLAERPNDPEALALRAELGGGSSGSNALAPATGSAGSTLLSEQASAALHAELASESPGQRAWIAYDPRDPNALHTAEQLAQLFSQAGWNPEPLRAIDFPIRPGLYLFAADDPPASSASAVARALEAAQLQATIGRGYRAFAAERRRDNPDFRGFQLAEDQAFVLAVGRAVP